MYLLGLDIGTSSIKASLLDVKTGESVANTFSPETEMKIMTPHVGMAEQDPEMWWLHCCISISKVLKISSVDSSLISAIGISYQMHGLVCVDKDIKVLRSSIIWCDSRAVGIGNDAFKALGETLCLEHFLNSPGNFTASKLKWVKENEPDIYKRIDKIMLPGDLIAARLTGVAATTVTGLSEGILWDFKEKKPASLLLNQYEIKEDLLSPIVPVFGLQGKVNKEAAVLTGLKEGTPVTYRAGDQPNNAFSLNVLQPGEIAATAGTSGVVYGVSDRSNYDPQSRVNNFVHVNNTAETSRNGILLCINGTGILNSWMKKLAGETLSYQLINELAAGITPGSDGLLVLPFGNGAERVLGNSETGCSIHNINFNIHGRAHMFRAAQEGIAFSFYYGIKIMNAMGVEVKFIKAGKANMFLSPVFSQTLADISGATIELYNTDGAQGAARGAGVGAGIFGSFEDAFAGLKKIETITPSAETSLLRQAYDNWERELKYYLGE